MSSVFGLCILFVEGFHAHFRNACAADDPYEKGSLFSEAWLAGRRCAEAEWKDAASAGMPGMYLRHQ
jgi:hypothetical protein